MSSGQTPHDRALKFLENCGLTEATATNILKTHKPEDVLKNPGEEALKYWTATLGNKPAHWVSSDWSEVQAALRELGFKPEIYNRSAPPKLRLNHIDMRTMGRDIIAGSTAVTSATKA